ncbi:Uncharacterized conserved protein YlxW, UPF0749 family [Peptoclostridium litorale DSM 5388]|uniref:Division initiation protein n=1 Tax=Peptoclostridium litorale DSM 5388 TaxID=1121324 RepID=A0A069RFQ3_PEPLI|nr:DUF881 domain-containing protein [Peptoclostridium litorale]KDR95025.1 hypothetical protein CLIT_11c00520 [Peptoclostridium litorale DSM 5388]SIN76291.1 Uncharacterized conserved protein YlxW, UPF0749 family [Peptoclostridium litorale DSM 5388]
MKNRIKLNTTVLLMFILGLITAIQVKSFNPDNIFVTLGSIKELEYQLDMQKIEIEKMEKLILEKEQNIAKYELALNENGSIKNLMKKELEDLKASVGMKDLSGPGVVVRLKDGSRDVEFGKENDIIVHDKDVLELVSDLKAAGAEAISINGERVITTSEIKCAGPTITINKSTYGQPFVIKATGNPLHLEAAVRAPGSYAYILKEVWGIDVQTQVSDNMSIPQYNGDVYFRYIEEGD